MSHKEVFSQSLCTTGCSTEGLLSVVLVTGHESYYACVCMNSDALQTTTVCLLNTQRPMHRMQLLWLPHDQLTKALPATKTTD